ncbi:hypothetical protein HHL17_20005 [Chitinophaga sp. G-6-1-13]|uniref:Uncharacterized protein n=1 Tax=Chitinophaga fulva TaxID=2728842 RepID=A0A848GM78_9BACT|nr:hypothetical protein [Chitinophaga fulva]NML39496.1 hypothetical protein [Chitinophaga fulva]
MKNKLRRMVINDRIYLYRIQTRYVRPSHGKLILKVFLEGCRNTPLVVECLVAEDLITGNPLFVGTRLFNKHTRELCDVNLNYPRYIRELIECGFGRGWTGTEKIDKQDGLVYLQELGYDIASLQS